MKNKKVLILLLAIIAVVALVLSGCSKKTEEAAEEVKQTVEEKAEEAAATVEEKAEEAAAAVEEKTEEVAAAAEETVEKAAEEVTEKAEEVVEKAEETAEKAAEEVTEKAEEVTEKAEEAAAAVEENVEEVVGEIKVMSYDDFVKAELDSNVCVEAYVQASQGWWAKDGVGRMTLYLQDENHGAYFAYEVLMEEEESKKLVPGTKIRISGVKAEWSGEVEIIDAKYEILEGSFIAEPEDVTALLGTDDLARHINEKIAIKDLKVAASKVEGKDEEFAFLYSWDGSGSHDGNSDLYFNVELNGQTYTLTVESYLCGNDTEVYKAVEGLKVGDAINVEGFLYWYNGPEPHITGVTVKEPAAAPPKTRKVGISLPTNSLQRWFMDGSNMNSMLMNAGCEVILLYADNDIHQQQEQIETMISDGCTVLVIAAVDGAALGEAVAAAKDRGITVIAYDRLLLDTAAVDYYVTFDNYRLGIIQGTYIRGTLGLDSAQGPFVMEITAGDPGDNNARYFYQGAMDVLKPYINSGKLIVKSGQIEFDDVATPTWKTIVAQERAEAILASWYADGTRIDAWLCSNDSTALGVIQALENNYAGPWPVITGQDCDLSNMKYLLAGKQAMSAFKDTRILVAQTVKMVCQDLNGEQVEINDTETYHNGVKKVSSFLCDPTYVDINNYREMLLDSGYYTEDQLQ